MCIKTRTIIFTIHVIFQAVSTHQLVLRIRELFQTVASLHRPHFTTDTSHILRELVIHVDMVGDQKTRKMTTPNIYKSILDLSTLYAPLLQRQAMMAVTLNMLKRTR